MLLTNRTVVLCVFDPVADSVIVTKKPRLPLTSSLAVEASASVANKLAVADGASAAVADSACDAKKFDGAAAGVSVAVAVSDLEAKKFDGAAAGVSVAVAVSARAAVMMLFKLTNVSDAASDSRIKAPARVSCSTESAAVAASLTDDNTVAPPRAAKGAWANVTSPNTALPY